MRQVGAGRTEKVEALKRVARVERARDRTVSESRQGDSVNEPEIPPSRQSKSPATPSESARVTWTVHEPSREENPPPPSSATTKLFDVG